jgi:hypothetical protein
MTATGSTRGVALEAGIFLGRQNELVRLKEAIRKRESLLIWGVPHSGKSALLARALAEVPSKMARQCILATGNGSPQEILRSIAYGFAEDPLFKAKFRADTGCGASFALWVKHQTSLRLRGLLYRAASAGEYRIILEDLAPMTHTLMCIVKQLMWNHKTPIYAVARKCTYNELGHAAQLYWNDRQRLQVGELSVPAAKELLEWSIRRHRLARFDLERFREDVLEFSGVLPGAMVRMCAAAEDARYHFNGRIKTKLLHVDYLLNRCQGMLQASGHGSQQAHEKRTGNLR